MSSLSDLIKVSNAVTEEDNTVTIEPVVSVSAEEESPTVVIESVNPSEEEIAGLKEDIVANYDFSIDARATIFNFKKSKDKDTGLETVRKPVTLVLPYPSVEGIADILRAGGKQLQLLFDAVESVINSAARDLLYEDTDLNAANFPVEKVSWKAISEIPKAQRRGGGIPKETWEEFAEDYIACMPSITGKTVEQVSRAAKIFLTKLATVKTTLPVIKLLVEQLTIYAEKAENAKDYEECIEFLLTKADTYMNLSEEDLLANL